MIKDSMIQSFSFRALCKFAAVFVGVAILAIAAIERIISTSIVWWMGAPLFGLWLLDVGYATEQRRCAELLKKDPTKEDSSVPLWEDGKANIFRFFGELLSLSIWPLYLTVFALIGFGGEEITKANREAAAQAEQKATTAAQNSPSYQQGNMSAAPVRSQSGPMPFNQMRFTPPPLPTPPRFTRPFATPPKAPPSSPASSPASR